MLFLLALAVTALSTSTEAQGTKATTPDDGSTPVGLRGVSVVGLQAGISYHSGDVNVGVTSLYNVFYGNWTGALPHSDALAVSIFNNFSAYIGQTPWYNILSTYWETGGATPTSAALAGSFFIDRANYMRSLSKSDVLQVISTAIQQGTIPATSGSSNNVYLFIVPEGKCFNFCLCYTSL